MHAQTQALNGGSYLATRCPTSIRKRDGAALQSFDQKKLRNAIYAAWVDSVGVADDSGIDDVVSTVLHALSGDVVDVESVQDAVETALMCHQQFKVAKSYILYRHQRQELRQHSEKKTIDPQALSDYIHSSKYARYVPELLRREVYAETVARVESMHVSQYPELADDIRKAFRLVYEKRVLPSMRSMQFGGQAILKNHNRLYNCSATYIDRWEAFSEGLFLLLSGCGVGYSVQFDHVERLSPVAYIDLKRVEHHVVQDTIEGWANALKTLIHSFQIGANLEISYHKVRAAGSPLKTSGGRAPGHLKLKDSLERVRGLLLSAQGRKLRPIEAHRIMCYAADAVLSGGIRRSAMIALFSLDDSEMMFAKTGTWWQSDPWFANANNSVVLKRDEVKKKQFRRIFQMTKEWGEPGFFFVSDYDHVTNPCCEINLYPTLTVTDEMKERLAARGIQTNVGDRHSGYAFCNLTEINAAKLTSYEDFLAAAEAATLIGTVQAAYTDMPYLGWVSEEIAKRDALLGIGMTGIMDAPHIALKPEYQRKIAERVKGWNREYAGLLGINSAARTTCVKPSGTTSLALGCVGSGIHPHHAGRYIRRVTADELEPVFQAFKAVNGHACVRKPDGKFVIEFPVQAPDHAILKGDQTAIEFLETVRSTQANWVVPGTERNHPGYNGGHHNVSNTVTVQPDEWDGVANYIWAHRDDFTGVSLLPSTGDKAFAFSPLEAVVTEADERRWLELVSRYKPVDYTEIFETDDGTSLSGEIACAGGSCEVRI